MKKIEAFMILKIILDKSKLIELVDRITNLEILMRLGKK